MENQSNYNCTQQEFYALADLAWKNYKDNLADFTAHKGKYTQLFGNNAIAALLAAKNLPDAQTRGDVPETFRIQLVELAENCLFNWQILKSYIKDAFPENLQKTKLEAAGSKFYSKAANESWPEMNSLLNAAAQFIDDNSEALSQDGNNMPSTFPEKFNNDKAAFETKYAGFIAAEQGSEGGTTDKIAANNSCNDTLKSMLADGQVIYKKNESKRNLFVFDTLLSYVSAPGATGLRIEAAEDVTELPVEGFAVTAQPGNVQGATDENGVLILSLSEGKFHITGIDPSYEPFVAEVEVTTGTVSRKKIILKKVA